MLFALMWLFDWSCSGFFFLLMLLLLYLFWAIGQAAKDIGNAAKSALDNEFVREAGKGIFEAWLESLFNKK